MGNRANKPQKPPSKASKPSGVKNEARAATKAQGTAESVDLELRNRPLKPSAERPKMVEESTPSPQPAVPESPKPKDKKGKTNTGSAEVLVKPKKSSNNSIKTKKLSTENKSAGKSSKSTKKPKKKEPATDLAESSIQTAQSQKEQKSSKDNNKSKRSTGATKSSTSGSGAKAAPHQDLTKVLANGFCDATLKKGVTGLRQEYARVKGETVPASEKVIAFVENHPSGRNRYRDVPCIDETRVKLKNHPQGYDYIHANYVTTPFSDKRFICSQAPLDTTCFDFWLMVLQEESEHVIMLCNFIETGKEKCAQYIPMEVGGSLVFQDITITVLSMDVLKTEAMTLTEKVCQRGIKIQKGDSERKIAHYHWESWPDHGLPSTDLSSLVLLQRVRQTKHPIVVHCSAGIGRTGSIVAIEFVLERIIFNQPCEDMAMVLKSLRNQRAFSIQTDLQYLYVHRILLRYYTELRYITPENPLLAKFLEEYDTAAANDPHKNMAASPVPAQSPEVQVPVQLQQQPEQQQQQEQQVQKQTQDLDLMNPPRW